jgi:hypothetical protein
MSTLSGNTIASSYPSLLRYDNFTGNTSSTDLIAIVDGLGNRTPLSLAGSKMSVRDNVDFTQATEVDFDGTKIKVAGTDIDFTSTNTTGMTKNVAVKTTGGRQTAIDGLVSYSAGTGMQITQDVGSGTFTFSATGATGGDSNIVKIGTGLTTTDGKALYWNGTDWSTAPSALNAYDKLIGISNGTNTLTDGVIIGGLVTKAAQTIYSAGDLYLSNTGVGFETNKNNVYTPGYLRGIGHSIGSAGIVLNPDIFYSASTIIPPSPTPSVTPSITPSVTITPTPSITPSVTPSAPLYDADALAYLQQVSLSGGTTGVTINNAVDTLFKSLKSNGLYTNMYFYPMVGGVAGSHAIEATLSGKDISWQGGMTHSASGATGNGTNSYGELINFHRNTIGACGDSSYGMEIFSSPAEAKYDMQMSFTDNNVVIGCYNGTTAYIRRNSGFKTASNTNLTGLYISTQTGTTTGTGKLIRNGSVLINTAQADQCTTTGDSWLGKGGGGGGASSSRGYSFLFYRDYLTDAQAATFSTIINTFQTALGRNTY